MELHELEEDVVVVQWQYNLGWLMYAFGWGIIGLSFIWDATNSPKTAVVLCIAGMLIAATGVLSFPNSVPGKKKLNRSISAMRWVMPWALAWGIFGLVWRFESDDWQNNPFGVAAQSAIWIIYAVLLAISIQRFIISRIMASRRKTIEKYEIGREDKKIVEPNVNTPA